MKEVHMQFYTTWRNLANPMVQKKIISLKVIPMPSLYTSEENRVILDLQLGDYLALPHYDEQQRDSRGKVRLVEKVIFLFSFKHLHQGVWCLH